MPRKKKEIDLDGPGPIDRQENLPVATPAPPDTSPSGSPPVGPAPSNNGEKERPLASFKCSTDRTTFLSVAVWGNEMSGQGGSTWIQYGITFSRSYRSQDGTWSPSTSYRVHDIPVLLYLMHRAHDWVTTQRAEDSTIPF